MYSDILEALEENAFVVGILVVIAAIFIMAIVSNNEEKKWNQFAVAHNCKVVQKDLGSTGVGYATNGNGGVVVTQSSPRIAWLCDDNITYWRDE